MCLCVCCLERKLSHFNEYMFAFFGWSVLVEQACIQPATHIRRWPGWTKCNLGAQSDRPIVCVCVLCRPDLDIGASQSSVMRAMVLARSDQEECDHN